jgi:hypothetical protein
MGIRERQARDRQATRRAILDAARDLSSSVKGHATSHCEESQNASNTVLPRFTAISLPKTTSSSALADEGFSILRDASGRRSRRSSRSRLSTLARVVEPPLPLQL